MPQFEDFTTEIQYLSQDLLYEKEKPYSADFIPENGEPPMNHIFQRKPALIKHIANPESFNMDEHGFCVLKAKTAVSLEDIVENQNKIEKEYINEIEALLHLKFPEYKRIETMNFIVRQLPSL